MVREAAREFGGEMVENEKRIEPTELRVADDEFAGADGKDFFDSFEGI